jgi:hypothetical protein
MELKEPIWERQKGERTKAYYLFSLYRDLGPLRTIEKVHTKYQEDDNNQLSIAQLQRYSSKCQWVCRAEAYDDHLNQLYLKEKEEAIKEMDERQGREYKEQMDIALKDYKDAPDIYKKNKAGETYDRAAKGERLAMGVATQKVEQSGKLKQEIQGEIHQKQTVSIEDKIRERQRYYEELEAQGQSNP